MYVSNLGKNLGYLAGSAFFFVHLQCMPNTVYVYSYVASQFTLVQTRKNGCVLKLQNVLRQCGVSVVAQNVNK